MKKSIIIIVLALLQCACAGSPGLPAASPALLGFAAISAEITVSYESLDPQYDASQAVAMNLE